MTHSSYWLDQDIFDDEDAGDGLHKIARLAGTRRAIANFVSILSGENIPVEFSSGQQSYTDGKRVVISAEDSPEKFDVMVGLALHEGSHVLLTDFDFLQEEVSLLTHTATYRRPMDNLMWLFGEPGSALRQVIGEQPSGYLQNEEYQANPFWDRVTIATSHLQTLMNVLEDRRIDKWVYTRAGGYRPYYDALYNRYFFTPEMGKNLRYNPEWRELTAENYINRLLYAFHPAADPDALPGLRALIKRMDINTIERVGPEHDPKTAEGDAAWKYTTPSFTNTPILWQEAVALYEHILKFVSLSAAPSKDQTAMDNAAQGKPDSFSDLPNLDGAPGMGDDDLTPTDVETATKGSGKNKVQVPGKYNETKAKKEMDEAKKVLTGDVKKKKITKREQEAVKALETANAKMVDLKGDGIPTGTCMVTRKLTNELLTQDWFIFKNWAWQTGGSNYGADDAVAAGKRMGQILVHRLQVRNDPLMTKQTRLPAGGLDRRLLAQLGMDITSVFQKSRVDIHKPAMLHLSLDASGSMHGKKWNKVRAVAVALAYVGAKLRNVDVVISIRGGENMPIVAIVFDSRKDQFTRFVRYARILEPRGATPEGLAFKATMDIVTEAAATHDVYFINFSDGQPAFHVRSNASIGAGAKRAGRASVSNVYYQGDLAVKHTREMVNQMRDAGVKVLSYFISEREGFNTDYHMKEFRKMYGDGASFVDVKNASEVLRTLNSLLLTRGG